MFQDMMDRIEDETARYLFFMQRAEAVPDEEAPRTSLPRAVDRLTGARGRRFAGRHGGGRPSQRQALSSAQSKAAQTSVLDLTRSIERKKQRELDQLQFVGGEAGTQRQPVLAKAKAGRNDPCPCGSGKKYKKCCGA